MYYMLDMRGFIKRPIQHEFVMAASSTWPRSSDAADRGRARASAGASVRWYVNVFVKVFMKGISKGVRKMCS